MGVRAAGYPARTLSDYGLCNRACPTTDYVTEPQSVDDFRERIHPKRDIAEAVPDFLPCPYYQVFEEKQGFQPNLSIVDLLFNMGPEGLLVLRDSIREVGR